MQDTIRVHDLAARTARHKVKSTPSRGRSARSDLTTYVGGGTVVATH